jgi:hypothetical protein
LIQKLLQRILGRVFFNFKLVNSVSHFYTSFQFL